MGWGGIGEDEVERDGMGWDRRWEVDGRCEIGDVGHLMDGVSAVESNERAQGSLADPSSLTWFVP